MSKQDDVLRRAFARLAALKVNLPTGSLVREDFVDEYHHVLDQMEAQGLGILEFRIPSEKVHLKVSTGNFATGRTRVSEHKYMQRDLFLLKLDGLMGYFTLAYDPDRPAISFTG